MTFYWAANSWQPLTDILCSRQQILHTDRYRYFHYQNRGSSFGHGYTAYWWTQFCSGYYLFHSILYYGGTMTVMDGCPRRACLHGCVRLRYERTPSGCTTRSHRGPT